MTRRNQNRLGNLNRSRSYKSFLSLLLPNLKGCKPIDLDVDIAQGTKFSYLKECLHPKVTACVVSYSQYRCTKERKIYSSSSTANIAK